MQVHMKLCKQVTDKAWSSNRVTPRSRWGYASLPSPGHFLQEVASELLSWIQSHIPVAHVVILQVPAHLCVRHDAL